MKKNRNLVILISLLSVAILAASVAVLWFFSNPGGVTRQQATANLVTFAERTLTLSAITGFAAMASLETVKRLFHLRGRFFFPLAAGPEFLRMVRPNRSGEPVDADHGEDIRRFDLPLEQIMAQLGHTADQAIGDLFTDRTESSLNPPKRRAHLEPPQRDTDEYKFLVRLLGKDSLIKAETDGDPTKLRLETQAALDDLQVSVGNAWRWRLRLVACMLSALFALAALIFVPVPPGSKTAALAASFLLGGFLAGFFRDLAAIVERFRRLCSTFGHTASRHEIPMAAAACIRHLRMAALTRRVTPC